jgi:hypothetical protein
MSHGGGLGKIAPLSSVKYQAKSMTARMMTTKADAAADCFGGRRLRISVIFRAA